MHSISIKYEENKFEEHVNCLKGIVMFVERANDIIYVEFFTYSSPLVQIKHSPFAIEQEDNDDV